MEKLEQGYSASHAVIIATHSRDIEHEIAALARLLSVHPYNFHVEQLIDTEVTALGMRNILRQQATADVNARVLLYFFGRWISDHKGQLYFACANMNRDVPEIDAIPIEEIFAIPQKLRAKHVALMIDVSTDVKHLTSIEYLLENHAHFTDWKLSTLNKAHQCLIRSDNSSCQTLIPSLLNQLTGLQDIEPITMSSIGYNILSTCYSHYFHLKGAVSGNFIFYDPPLRYLPTELRTVLTHPQPIVRRVAITEADHYFHSQIYVEHIRRALETIAISDEDQEVRLRAQEVINQHTSTLYINLHNQSEAIKAVIGDPFEWAYIPAGQTTLLD